MTVVAKAWHFEGHLPPELGILGQEYSSHASFADHPQETIATEINGNPQQDLRRFRTVLANRGLVDRLDDSEEARTS